MPTGPADGVPTPADDEPALTDACDAASTLVSEPASAPAGTTLACATPLGCATASASDVRPELSAFAACAAASDPFTPACPASAPPWPPVCAWAPVEAVDGSPTPAPARAVDEASVRTGAAGVLAAAAEEAGATVPAAVLAADSFAEPASAGSADAAELWPASCTPASALGDADVAVDGRFALGADVTLVEDVRAVAPVGSVPGVALVVVAGGVGVVGSVPGVGVAALVAGVAGVPWVAPAAGSVAAPGAADSEAAMLASSAAVSADAASWPGDCEDVEEAPVPDAAEPSSADVLAL